MSEDEPVTGFARALERALSSTARATHRHPIISLAIALVATGLAVNAARGLRVNTDLASLLPDTFQSVRDLQVLKKRFGGVGYVVVVGQNAEPDQLKRFASDIAPKLAGLKGVSYVEYKRASEFFRDRALYFLESDDLEIIKERIEDRADYHRKKANPLLVDLEDDSGPPSLDFSDIEKKYKKRGLTDSGLSRIDETESFLVDPKRKLVAVLVKPANLATNLSFAKEIVGRVQDVVDGIDLKEYGPEFTIELTGRYKKKIDQQKMIEGDLAKSSGLALALVLLYLIWHFRRLAAVVLLIVPLLMGLACTFGFAAVAFDDLNILSAFVGAILLGLGIDHGIHLLGRFQSERSAGHPPDEAIRRTFSSTGRAIALAGFTTIVGFGGLAVSGFKAFREFGIITAAGMFFAILAYSVVLPALLGVAGKLKWKPRAEISGPVDHYCRAVSRWGPTLFWIVFVAASYPAVKALDVRFDYDFASLDGGDIPSFHLDRVVNEVLGRSQTPIVLLTDTVAEEAEAAAAIRKRAAESGDASGVDFVVALADLVPKDQEGKQDILREIADAIANVQLDAVPEQDRRRFTQFRDMTKATPFAVEDLPTEIQRQFRPERGSVSGGLVLIFPSVSLSDGERVIELAKEVRGVPMPGGKRISAAGEAMVLADVLTMIFQESPIVVSVTLSLVFLALWMLLGRIRVALLCFAPALLTVICTIGLVHLTGLKFNYLNIVIVPVLFGLAVDGAVHLVIRGAAANEDLVAASADTGRAILGATLTTAMGFGALLLAHHPGLNSFGSVALLGLGANICFTMIWLLSLLALRTVRTSKLAAVGLGATWSGRTTGDLATVWGAGYSPKAPGTMGAVAALPIGWLLSLIPWMPRAAILIVGVGLSIWIAQRYVAGGREDLDPSEVVVDESIGVLLALAFVPWELPWIVAAFVLFRLFDILKPGPVGWLDRNMKNGAGIIMDDVAAGLLAGLILFAVRGFLG